MINCERLHTQQVLQLMPIDRVFSIWFNISCFQHRKKRMQLAIVQIKYAIFFISPQPSQSHTSFSLNDFWYIKYII